jgi:hypothetical protein
MSRKKITPRGSRRWVKKFNLAREVHYIPRRAAERDGRFVTVGELAFFSCETGDAWVLEHSRDVRLCLHRDLRGHRARLFMVLNGTPDKAFEDGFRAAMATGRLGDPALPVRSHGKQGRPTTSEFRWGRI